MAHQRVSGMRTADCGSAGSLAAGRAGRTVAGQGECAPRMGPVRGQAPHPARAIPAPLAHARMPPKTPHPPLMAPNFNEAGTGGRGAATPGQKRTPCARGWV